MQTSTDTPQTTPWLTPREVGKILRIGRSLLYDMIKRGEIPARRFGRLLRVPASAVLPAANNAGEAAHDR